MTAEQRREKRRQRPGYGNFQNRKHKKRAAMRQAARESPLLSESPLVLPESPLLTDAHELMAGAAQATRNHAEVDEASEGDDARDSGANSSSTPKPYPPFRHSGTESK